MKTYIGIDNGVSGTIGIIPADEGPRFLKTPTKNEQDYTKKKKNITRLDANELACLLGRYCKDNANVLVLIERPLVNPRLFMASTSALRCHEATLVTIENLCVPYQFIDSKDWQKVLLPKGCDTKKASLDIGNRLFPQFKEFKHPDRDGILIAEWARRSNL